MVLKEAFRLQNVLSSYLKSATNYLRDTDNVVTVTEKHNRVKAYKDAENEELQRTNNTKLTYSTDMIIDFAVTVLDISAKLDESIARAKATADISIDAATGSNKRKRDFITYVLEPLLRKKADSVETTGRAMKFNVAGDQVSYTYPVTVITSIDYNRNAVKAIEKRLRTSCDDISAAIDKINTTVDVDFTCIFDVNDSFEDALEVFAKVTERA